MAGKKSLKSRLKSIVKPDSVETYREGPKNIVKGIASSLKDDVLAASVTDMWAQIYSPMSEHTHDGVKRSSKPEKKDKLKKGEPVTLFEAKSENKNKKASSDIAPGLDYRQEILRGSERLSHSEKREMGQRINDIMIELKKLVDTSTVLQAQFTEVATNQAPVDPGKYHLNFFEWMLIMIRTAREKVADSGAWLAAMQSKKKSRQYGSMAKKHGTTFTLSNERMVATQTG